ncbi:efflux RND transporter permease subunit [Thiomicrospira sp. ALE5]|uniref:efflux RND transporter permease subunit n=1 Tax=Thiomicrospira sp. ALE5 TaxID=748650 RepID=UPI0008EEAFDC|nr:efflux RND transporter permease subunit [Thiomicrospira sp. ALE5]SFR54533.1 multidrug efflux pump [Thiomicrospira sp. ALE5]
MLLSDTAVKRPVLAAVFSLLLVAFGMLAFDRLPLREYPNIDPPIVSITTGYPGASAAVIESRITKLIEDQIAGIEGISFIESTSSDGRSRIRIEFNINRDIDSAANDVRDRVARVARNLPDGADQPEVQKVDGDDDVIVWFNLTSDNMTVPELTDYARRYLVDRFSVLDGVARVRIGGGQEYAMRLWLDANEMAMRNITVSDVERTLRSANIELPAGTVTMQDASFSVRVDRQLTSVADFERLVVKRGSAQTQVRLADIARIELGSIENRSFFRGNGLPMIGLGIIKQSTANTITVAEGAADEVARLNAILPEGMAIKASYDSSVFIKSAINEVYKTLAIAIVLVMLVILLFLRSVRVALIPLVTVPVSIIATFWVLWMLGFSINLLTLLALVLAIGLVVDDAIVVLENVQRHIEKGFSPLAAAFLGTRQVGFAVIATTLVLVAVFFPISFLQGTLGRLFSEFAITLTVAVIFSSFVALTLSPALASKLLKARKTKANSAAINTDPALDNSRPADYHAPDGMMIRAYRPILKAIVKWPIMILPILFAAFYASYWLFQQLPEEYAPREDRGAFFIFVSGPEGATHDYMKTYLDEVEARLMPLVENGEINRLLIRSPRGFGNTEIFNTGIGIVVLNDWAERRPANEIMQDVRDRLADLPGIRANPVMRQGIGGRVQKPVQFVLGGGSYAELAEWRRIITDAINDNNPGFEAVDWDYKETKPQLRVNIDYEKAFDMGVTTEEIGRTLQTLLGSTRVTTFVDQGEEYDIILQADRRLYRSPTSLDLIHVRSNTTGELIPLSSLVSYEEFADSGSLNRYNRMRSVTIDANLAPHLSLGDGLAHLEGLARELLPADAMIDYKGQSRDFQTSGNAVLFVFLLGLLVVFLVLSAQFESFVSPFIIMLTVPLAVLGGLLGLWLHGLTLNLYTQIGLVMLIGLATKNGILIVEFANQLRDQGIAFKEALIDASCMRLRPILMTAITTCIGATPLIMSSGAGAETRYVLGMVLIWGVAIATVLTLIVIPAVYALLGRFSQPAGVNSRALVAELGTDLDRYKK